ncbi:MAG: 4Fe-4S dicluster domain-containing protein [Rhodospirillales bacterium]|jgi:ferredoxin
MKLNGKEILLCDCEGTMKLPEKALAKLFGAGEIKINTHLCRAQIGNFTNAVSSTTPLLVACTQEAPLFVETGIETNPDANVSYTNIRERAGWSEEGEKALPKIRALIQEATLDAPLANSLTMRSEGSVLVYGLDETTLEIAKQISNRLNVTCLFKTSKDIQPPRLMDVPIFVGRIKSATGHLGAYEVVVDDYAAIQVSSRGGFEIGTKNKDVSINFDLILDLSNGEPLFPAPEKRDGYFHIETSNAASVQKALFEIVDLVGEFEKPRYIKYDANICVHARSSQVGCTRCLDVCPTSAITPAQDEVKIDPYICAGCGSCASVCPTGAVSYQLPAGNFVFERVKLLLDSYREAGGNKPILLLHDTQHGEEMMSAMAHLGRGLPANVLPFAINEVTQIGFDFFAAALAFGADAIKILLGPANFGETTGLESQIELADTAAVGLGYGANRVLILDQADPEAVADALYSSDTYSPIKPGDFAPMGTKRSLVNLALNHLHEHAPTPVDLLPLSTGAPFGAIEVNTEGCTLCLSCVSACPTGALKDNPDSPQFTFTETACVQCGLCQTICPETVITLAPRFNFNKEARVAVVVKEEEPFECVICGDPFGVKSSINQMVEKLRGHSMFSDDAALERIKMCPNCRVNSQFDDPNTPMAVGDRPEIRTTNDYLKERENLRSEAEEYKKMHGLEDPKDT